MWEYFIQWLKTKKIASVKDIQDYCEWKWLLNKHSELLCAKGNDDEHKVCKKQAKIIVKVTRNMRNYVTK